MNVTGSSPDPSLLCVSMCLSTIQVSMQCGIVTAVRLDGESCKQVGQSEDSEHWCHADACQSTWSHFVSSKDGSVLDGYEQDMLCDLGVGVPSVLTG